MYKKRIKRLLDFSISLLLIIVLFPILIFFALLLFINFKKSPFFTQSRPGYLTKEIRIIKFKTMNDKRDDEGALLPDKHRLTSIGKLLRKLSIDELPQLINVLKGDMSLIGPRPLLFKYLPLYSPTQNNRHSVKPGITGWAQVNGRNSISWTKKFELDVFYVDNLSLKLDLKIIGLTLSKVLKQEGVNQSNERPMQPFNGKN